MIEQHQHHENHVILIGTFQQSEDWPSGGEWRVIGAWSAIWVTDDGIMLIQNVPTYVWTRHDVLLGTDHLTCRWGLWFFVSFRIFFSDNTRVRIFIFFQNLTVELYAELSEYDEESFFRILLGKDPSTDLCAFDLDAFKRLCYIHLVKSSAEYNRILTATVHN
jgi:hypothetical protein